MKAFLAACVAIVVIAIGASLVLDHYQKSAEAAFATTGARIAESRRQGYLLPNAAAVSKRCTRRNSNFHTPSGGEAIRPALRLVERRPKVRATLPDKAAEVFAPVDERAD